MRERGSVVSLKGRSGGVDRGEGGGTEGSDAPCSVPSCPAPIHCSPETAGRVIVRVGELVE